MQLAFFIKGILFGFVLAAPLGPIGILCTRRMLTHGRRAGFFSGMGAATADVIYGFIAAFGLTYISDFLFTYRTELRVAGGAILCYIGIKTLLAKAEHRNFFQPSVKRYAGMFSGTFFLTLTNPMTIFSMAAAFAGFGLAGARGSALSAGTLCMGVFFGSGIWWLFLIGFFSLFRRRLHHHELHWVNRIAGAIITISGVLALASLSWG